MTSLLPIANFEEVFPFMIPIMALMIPIVAILVHHQQKMAQIIHGSPATGSSRDEINALRREVQELKELLNQQSIAIDGLQDRRPLPPSITTAPSVPQRLSEV